MMRLSIMAGLVLASSAVRAGGIPYASSADVPDYVATMTAEEMWGKSTGPQTRIVTQHGGWVRVDEQQATIYGNPAKQTSIVIRPHPEASYSSVLIYREIPASSLGVRGTSQTGQTELHAGETCTVRKLLRGDPDRMKNGPQWLSCLTADGIEIGAKVLGNGGSPEEQVTLVRLERRPVSTEEVSPPADLLDVAQWLHFDDKSAQDATAVEQSPDYALHMHSEDATRTVRRHSAWTYDERSYADGRRYLIIWNDQTGQQLSFNTLKGGAFEHLSMLQKYLPGQRIYFPNGRGLAGAPKSTGKNSSVMGEPCAWFDMTPNMADGSLHHCLTQDGIPLKIRTGGLGPSEEFVADEVQRRDLKAEEILPPADVLTRSNWDFPE
ncbi:hypothetical protein [Mesorhizobium loti]|uniref:DUF4412 domain-containing protein n=1 Tax=Mesorhizobium loti R88b TaxID=935548 RepID=A0A6M7WSL8_RHILI|nr:hypothetical protein [Mesorhizobium loti]QKD02838.1 hypothetical protein EB235_16070 [Mesorhizobium loti R88b]